MTGRFGLEMAIGVLAFVGLWVTVDKAAAGILRGWAWLVRDRVTPLLEDDDEDGYVSSECASGEHWECEGCWCECGHDIDLPPEQSAEALGFTGPPPPSPEVRHWRDLEARRERVASAAEAEQRAAYESLGFDFPSGLMARVREAAP